MVLPMILMIPIIISIIIVSSDRSSYSDVVLIDVQLFQILIQSIDAIDVTSVTLSCLNSINALMSQDAN